ncbi:MAG: hypothetical protein Kow0031_08310 [Anaerolineae bacterium]
MNKILFGSGVCCPPSAEGVTYLRIGPQQRKVGMMGIETVFQQLSVLGREPDTVTDSELVDMARKSNYIPEGAIIEAEYAVALREAYAQFCNRRKQREAMNSYESG